jgi:L-arabinokinase
MGGIADYSGSLVLQMPTKNRTAVSITLRNDLQCNLKSKLSTGVSEVEFDYNDLRNKDYSSAHKILNRNKDTSWMAYIIGCVFTLEKEKKIDFRGADFHVDSNVPLGKGVSSSAAIEVATMKALAQAFNIEFQGTELAVLAQRVENIIVGAPCGLMDQLASCYAPAGELLPIVCQPDILRPSIIIPAPIKFIGVDSGVRHAVSGSSYSEVRCAAFMGYSIIAQHLGIHSSEIKRAKESGNTRDLPFGGYLCNIGVVEFENRFRSILPDKISGAEFLEKFKATTDSVTSIDNKSSYRVLNCTSHPVYENDRVTNFQFLISNFSNSKNHLHKMGELMFQSHESYSACGLGSKRTSEIVELAKRQYSPGIYGAKITGGGSGGTVCLLAVGEEGIQSAKKVHRMMEKSYNTKLGFFD